MSKIVVVAFQVRHEVRRIWKTKLHLKGTLIFRWCNILEGSIFQQFFLEIRLV